MLINPVDHPKVKLQYIILQSSKQCCHFGRLSLGGVFPNDGGIGFGVPSKAAAGQQD